MNVDEEEWHLHLEEFRGLTKQFAKLRDDLNALDAEYDALLTRLDALESSAESHDKLPKR